MRFSAQRALRNVLAGLADIDGDGNLDVVLAGFRSCACLGDGRGGVTRVTRAPLPKLRSVTATAQAPQIFAFGEFTRTARSQSFSQDQTAGHVITYNERSAVIADAVDHAVHVVVVLAK